MESISVASVRRFLKFAGIEPWNIVFFPIFSENRDFVSVFLLHLYIAIFELAVIIGFTNKLTDTYVAFGF